VAAGRSWGESGCRHWGDTWWRVTTGVAARYNAAATGTVDDEPTGASTTQTGGRSAGAEPTLSGIR